MNRLYHKYSKLSTPIKAAFWFTFCNFLQKGISVIAVPIYTRILSADQYGSYSVFISWLEIFEILATFRIGWGGYVVGLTKYEKDRDTYATSMQSLSIVITTVSLGIYLLFSEAINSFTEMNTKATLVIFAILYAVPAIQFWTVRKRIEYKYLSVLCVTVLSSFFCVVCGVIAAFFCQEKDFAIICVRAVVQGIIAICLIIITYRKKFVFFQRDYWRRALRFNVPLLPYYLSTVLLHSSDKIIIKNLVGHAQAGIYGVAYTASVCMQLFSASINQVLQPWFFKRIKDDRMEGISKIINSALILVAGLNLMLISLAPEVIEILAPKEYYEAIWCVPPLASSVVVMFFYQYFVNVEFYFEESKLTAIASVGAAVLNVGLNYWLIPKCGYIVAGYTTLVSYTVFGVMHYFFMRHICKKHDFTGHIFEMKKMIVILVIFGILAAVLTVGYMVPIIRYIAIAVFFGGLIMNKKKIVNLVLEMRH